MHPFSSRVDRDQVSFDQIQFFPIGMGMRLRRAATGVKTQKTGAYTGSVSGVERAAENLFVD
jgi:hypothetical protein